MLEKSALIPSSTVRRIVFGVAALALLLPGALLWSPGQVGAAAKGKAKYGTPLKFDKPPVDTGSPSADLPAPRVQRSSPPERQAAPAKKSSAASASPSSGGASTSTGGAIRLFGTVEFRSPIKNLPKWERVLKAERSSPSFRGGGLEANNQKVAQRWAAAQKKLSGASLMEQVKEVNKFFNVWPYKTDIEVWGVEDYWATPKEFVKKSGDCEDYAISKYYALRTLGVPAKSMRVVAVKDTIRNLGHAVLVVYAQNEAYILDNLSNMVLSHKKLPHYSPQYSVNEEFLWRHVKPKAAPGT